MRTRPCVDALAVGLVTVGLVTIGVGCGIDDQASAGMYFGDSGFDFGTGATDTGSSARDMAMADMGSDAPPEQEERPELQAPRASRSYVFVANRTLNTVARIDSLTLQVSPIEVCIEPTLVRTLPTSDRAVVLCRGDDQVAVVDADGGDEAVGFSWVAENANQLLLSPGGDYALAWFDEGSVEGPADDAGNPHDLTLVDLGARGEEPASYLLSVGFGIRSIQFDSSGEWAYVTTEDGLNVIELGAVESDQFVPLHTLGDDPLALAVDREVLVTDDGNYAFVRSSAFSGLRVLDLTTDTLADIELPAVPTDLDLLPGGESVLAVMREVDTVAILPLPEAVESPESVRFIELEGAAAGLARVTPDGETALIYSTVGGAAQLTRLALSDGSYETFLLRKPIAGVSFAPGGTRALVRHVAQGGTPVPGEPVESFIAKSFGYSLFDLETGFTRLVLSPAEPGEIVYSEDGGEAFVMLADEARDVRAVQRLDFASFRTDTLEMSRLPEQIGVVPATGRIYVSQLADTGRITFIDSETGEQRHVTAYELNRRIE